MNILETHQESLENLYSRCMLMPRLRKEFTEDPNYEFPLYLKEQGIPEKFGIDLLCQMALHKRAKLEALVGLLRHHFEGNSQRTADMLHLAAKADLVDWSPQLKIFIVKFNISADVQYELDRFQHPLPMVIPPREIKNNLSSGYLHGSESVLLRDNHHEDDVCLDHLNRVDKVPLTVNMTTASMIKNQWKNMDKPKVGETRIEFERRKKAFEKFNQTAMDVLGVLMAHSDKFYLTHRYDKRGRIYAVGYTCNYQGNSWQKAQIEFHEKELVDEA